MSSDKQKSLAAMRTFARDVEREKGTKEEPVDTKPEPQAKVETSKDKKTAVPKAEEKKASQPKEIPPFHEINKSSKKPIRTDIKAESEQTKKEKPKSKKGIEPAKKVGGGTVITDNKKPKRSFFGSVQKSISGWFGDLKDSLTPKKNNTYVVTKTERRKGVVQKATSKTGTIFSADSDTVKEQIRARQRAEKREHEEDINWSPYTEPGYPLLEGEIVESSDPRIESISVTPKTHSVPKSVIKETEKIPELQEKKEEPLAEPEVEETEPVIEKVAAKPEPAAKSVPEPEKKEGPITQAEVDESVIEYGEEDEDDNETWSLENASLKDTNTIAMLVVSAVIAIAIFAFVIFGIFSVGQNAETNSPEFASNLYPGISELKPIILSERSSRELVTKANLTLTENQNQTAEYYFVTIDENEVAADILMDLLRTYKNDNFAEVVTNVRYIETADEKRALLLEAPAESIALGSMLNWEPTLFVDVGALLDVPNVPINAGEFIDAQIGNLDVRVLNFDGRTLLVYSVVNQTSVVIADDISVLEAFLES